MESTTDIREDVSVVPAMKGKTKRNSKVRPVIVYPVPPTAISTVITARHVVNHSYRDFSQVPPAMDHPELPHSIDEMSFPLRLHQLLIAPESSDTVSWLPHGRGFRLVLPKVAEGLFKHYLNVRQLHVFLSLLNSYGFRHITKGRDRNSFYHELFLRGLPHLCYYFEPPRNARRLLPDPQNEPDLYEISQRFPVPPATLQWIERELAPTN